MKDKTIDQMRLELMAAQRRQSDVPVHAAKGGIVRLLRKHGEGVPNELEAMRRMSQGHRVFVVHEQDERPVEITSVRDLAGYAPDQIYTLAPQHKAHGGVIHKADGGSLIGSLVETIPAVKPVVNALGFRRSVTEPAELPPNLLQRPDYDLELEQNPLGFLPRSTRPADLPQNLSAFRADPTGKYGGTEGLETQAIRRFLLGGDLYNKRNLDPATSNTYTDPTKAVAEVYRYARMLGAAQKYGYPSLTPEEAAAFVLKEGRSDLGHSGVTFGHKKDVEFDKMLNDMYNIHARDRNFLSALHSKKRIADKFGISLAEAWNGVGVNDVGQTGAQYAKDWEAHKKAATHAKNKPLVDLIARGIAEGQKYGLPLKANRATDEISQTKQVPYAVGGTVQGGSMPTLAEMRLALMRQNPVNLKNIGVNEATNMDQKIYLPPNRPEGLMHAGGVDMSHEVPGQQLMPLLPGTAPGQPGVPGQPPTGMPQGQMPGAQASPLPAGFNTQAAPNAFPPSAPQPQPPSNILSMLPQGRALNAMQPTKMPAMASGGLTKTYTHEVFNRKTGETKGQYQSIETARKARDRYDNQYGAYVHDVRPTGNVKPRPFENSKQAMLRDLKSGTADQYMTGVERFQQRAADRLKEAKLAEGGSARPKFSIKPAEESAKEPDQFSAYDSDNPSVPSLAQAFDEAIKHHLSLSPEERAKNSVRASEKVGDIIGRTSSGKVKDLLGKNAKLLKSEKGKDDEAIKLPDGRGVETTGLALSPAYRQGKFDTCPNHHSCKDECLGKTSGNYFKLGGGQDLSEFKGPRLNSLMKTHAFLQDPHSFAVKLHDEIHDAKAIAAQNGNHLGVRLNVLSDINPRVHRAIIHAHPDVTFYDYTKNNTDPIAENHHYTYSSTGASQPGVENEHTNWKSMRRRLDKGDNVAMAFSHKDHLPEHVHDQETGKKYRVVNGDTHDFRPLDLQPEGEDGVIIGLKNKKATGKMNEAHIDSRGFFMHYDPQLKMAKNKKGVPIYERDKNGNTIPQNKTVSIQPQAHKMIPISNDDGEKV